MNTGITNAQAAKWGFLMTLRETFRIVTIDDAQALIDKEIEERKIFLISLRASNGAIEAQEVDLNDASCIRVIGAAILSSNVVMGIPTIRFPSFCDHAERRPSASWWKEFGAKTLNMCGLNKLSKS